MNCNPVASPCSGRERAEITGFGYRTKLSPCSTCSLPPPTRPRIKSELRPRDSCPAGTFRGNRKKSDYQRADSSSVISRRRCHVHAAQHFTIPVRSCSSAIFVSHLELPDLSWRAAIVSSSFSPPPLPPPRACNRVTPRDSITLAHASLNRFDPPPLPPLSLSFRCSFVQDRPIAVEKRKTTIIDCRGYAHRCDRRYRAFLVLQRIVV